MDVALATAAKVSWKCFPKICSKPRSVALDLNFVRQLVSSNFCRRAFLLMKAQSSQLPCERASSTPPCSRRATMLRWGRPASP
eukprot:586852-Rhodomonas_salina.1